MKKQTFLLIVGIYGALLGLLLILMPNVLFQGYGFPKISDIPHDILIGTANDFIFYAGVNSLGVGVLCLLSRNGIKLKTVFLVGAIVFLICGMMVMYKNINGNTPIAAWVDMLVRTTIGLGFFYYYFQEKESFQTT